MLLSPEASLGRTRGERWAPRVIDIDLLLYGEAVLDGPELTLPHPREEPNVAGAAWFGRLGARHHGLATWHSPPVLSR